MADTIHFSIRGTCILRDTFGITKDSKNFSDDVGYAIDRFVQTVSPISAVQSGKINVEGKIPSESDVLKLPEFKNKSNFIKRNFLLDMERQVFDYMFECQSDYFILDMAGCRYDLFNFLDDSDGTYLTYVPWYSKVIDIFKEKGYIDKDYKIINSDDEIFALLDKYIPIYLNKILEHYSPERIILFEIYPVRYYITGDENYIGIFSNKEYERLEKRMRYGYNKAKEILNGCHIIEFPDYVIGNKNHKWGISNLHYIDEYYEYAFKAISVIVNEDNDAQTELHKLKSLKKNYSQICHDRYGKVFWNGVNDFRKKSLTLNKYKKYADYFKYLLENQDKATALVSYLIDHEYFNCAFYGCSQIALYYVDSIKKYGIKVDYIIENLTTKQFHGIPIVRRDAPNYPDTDIIIIADAINFELIRSKLQNKTTIPYTDIYEIFE